MKSDTYRPSASNIGKKKKELDNETAHTNPIVPTELTTISSNFLYNPSKKDHHITENAFDLEVELVTETDIENEVIDSTHFNNYDAIEDDIESHLNTKNPNVTTEKAKVIDYNNNNKNEKELIVHKDKTVYNSVHKTVYNDTVHNVNNTINNTNKNENKKNQEISFKYKKLNIFSDTTQMEANQFLQSSSSLIPALSSSAVDQKKSEQNLKTKCIGNKTEKCKRNVQIDMDTVWNCLESANAPRRRGTPVED